MNWNSGGTSWLEGLSAFLVLVSILGNRVIRRRLTRKRRDPDA